MYQKLAQAIGVAGTLLIAALSPSQAAENVHVRGSIVGLDGSTLTVKTREGPTSAVALKPGWKVAGVAKASVEDIRPGDFVGIASLPTAAGGDGAVEVLVFPPTMKGVGEGAGSHAAGFGPVHAELGHLRDPTFGSTSGPGRKAPRSSSSLQ